MSERKRQKMNKPIFVYYMNDGKIKEIVIESWAYECYYDHYQRLHQYAEFMIDTGESVYKVSRSFDTFDSFENPNCQLLITFEKDFDRALDLIIDGLAKQLKKAEIAVEQANAKKKKVDDKLASIKHYIVK